MSDELYHRKMSRALDRMGGLYHLNDIRTAIDEGRMQSFVENNSWAVTQVTTYPRARTLDVICTVGDLGDCRILHGRILEYAREIGLGLVVALGRRGWERDARQNGWKIKTTSYLYHKEL
jgi:hypothetical protein